MGLKYVTMFDDEIFLSSINKAKWNIYSIALQDLTFYSFLIKVSTCFVSNSYLVSELNKFI